MKNTFINKVDAERKVLKLINQDLCIGSQLTGLSERAIENWGQDAGFHSNSQIIRHLKTIARTCQSLSDRSHETFNSTEEVISSSFEQQLSELKNVIIEKHN